VPAGAREGGGELIHSGQVALAGQDDEFSRLRHSARRHAGDHDYDSSRPKLHGNLPSVMYLWRKFRHPVSLTGAILTNRRFVKRISLK
jgi:hypothetical protein